MGLDGEARAWCVLFYRVMLCAVLCCAALSYYSYLLLHLGTIWESWDDTTNSHNHPMFTAVSQLILLHHKYISLGPSELLEPGHRYTYHVSCLLHAVAEHWPVFVLHCRAGSFNMVDSKLPAEWQPPQCTQ